MHETRWQVACIIGTPLLGLLAMSTFHNLWLKVTVWLMLSLCCVGCIIWLEHHKHKQQNLMAPSGTAQWADALACPLCGQAMEKGWIAIYEPMIITRAIWQAVQPGYVRMRAPSQSVTVVQPQVGGGGCPEAFLCRHCEISIFSYDRQHVT